LSSFSGRRRPVPEFPQPTRHLNALRAAGQQVPHHGVELAPWQLAAHEALELLLAGVGSTCPEWLPLQHGGRVRNGDRLAKAG
jgi:hypothetical protein